MAVPARHACAQEPAPLRTVGDLVVPGGLESAAAVLGDRLGADDPHFLLDLIRRFHASAQPAERASAQLRQLLAHLDAHAASAPGPEATFNRQAPADERHDDTLPLPLPGRTWMDVVFDGRTTTSRLLADILRTRSTSLFYYALLSLDDETRSWLEGEPALVKDLSTRDAVRFVAAAPGLRVANSRVRPPGGERAEPAWEALVGCPVTQPRQFVRALLGAAEGRLSLFYGAMASVPEPRLAFAFDLDAGVRRRVAAVQQLSRVFDELVGSWQVDDDAFRRPAFDPAMLLADLSLDEHGAPVVAGTAAFWSTVFEDLRPAATPRAADAGEDIVAGPPVDFSWLCQRLLGHGQFQYRRAHLMVLFASRVVKNVTRQNARDAVDAVRAAGVYPALSRTLERAGVNDVSVFAAAARRATQLSSIADDARATRSIAQFQGAVFLVGRAAARGGWPSGDLNRAISSLAKVEPATSGDYRGGMIDWLSAFVASTRPRAESPNPPGAVSPAALANLRDAHDLGALDLEVLGLLAGTGAGKSRFIDWEGNRYQVDFSAAEAQRLVELLGETPPPYLTTANTLITLARRVEAGAPARAGASSTAVALEELRHAAPWEGDVRDDLARSARDARSGEPSRLAGSLRLLADDLLARGLVQYAYAVALGEPGRTPVAAREMARRHAFGPPTFAHAAAWQLATMSADDGSPWQLNGSILGLDVVLAERALVATSERPPARPPTIDPAERRALAEAVVLVSPPALTDVAMDRIRAAMRRGRDRLAGLRSAAEARDVADAIHATPERRTLLAWTTERRPESLAVVLPPVEVFWLGVDHDAPTDALDAWGAPADGRMGCLCLHLDSPRWLDALGGRWGAAVLASGFPDLNLRLAELLGDLGMPASLFAAVLSPATFDLVTAAHVRDRDDRRGLEAFVRALDTLNVEQYLALLTTGGPLVPVDDQAPGQLAPAPGVRR